ncbi:MAG: hypothetical protein E6Q83_05195 [Thiothrix sp.]|nr:MAG: hypothetical protein E6Q83_05195 [Thiothrix sp.]
MDIATPTARRSLREPIAALALFIGGLAWIAAFWFPSFYTSQGSVEGYWVFATGWMGFAIFQFAWYANLLMLLGIVLMYSSPLWGSTLAGFAMLVATQAFWFNSIPTGEVDLPILQLGQGFWCWYGSIIMLGIGVFLGSEHTEAEKNQTTKHKSQSESKPQLKRLHQSSEPTLILNKNALSPIILSDQPKVSGTTEPVYDAVISQTAPAMVANTSVASVLEQELNPDSVVVTKVVDPTESQPINAPTFAVVPEPELPDFPELTAANEQEYFQLPHEVALKPVYTEHLAEDWPPKMSLVVNPDPFTTDRHLDPLDTELLAAVEQANATVAPKVEPTPPQDPRGHQYTVTGFFDPWRT